MTIDSVHAPFPEGDRLFSLDESERRYRDTSQRIETFSAQDLAGDPKRDIVGSVTRQQVEEIAKVKMVDLNANDLDAACKIIAGTARSMGIEVS